jgi:DnaJ-class molecular chaperone
MENEIECTHCNGSGEVKVSSCFPWMPPTYRMCLFCTGTGKEKKDGTK